jgi:hypothetical protein
VADALLLKQHNKKNIKIIFPIPPIRKNINSLKN